MSSPPPLQGFLKSYIRESFQIHPKRMCKKGQDRTPPDRFGRPSRWHGPWVPRTWRGLRRYHGTPQNPVIDGSPPDTTGIWDATPSMPPPQGHNAPNFWPKKKGQWWLNNPKKGLISSEWAPATAFPRFWGDLEETFVGNKSFHSTLDHRDISFSKISQIDIKILCPDFEIPWFHMEEIGILWISIF